MTTEATETTGTTEGASTPNEAASDAAVDAAALAAAREAMGTAEPEAKAAPVVEPAAGGAPVGDETTELQRLRADIKSRENERKARETLEAEYGTKLAKALETERTKLAAEARAQLIAEYKRGLETDPANTIRGFGIDGAELVTELARRAGPAGAVMTEVAQLKAKIEHLENGGGAFEKYKAEQEAKEKERETAYVQQQRSASEKQFVAIVTEKAPAVLAFYGDETRALARANELAQEYCEAKGVPVCPFPALVQELQAEAKAGVADRVKALEASLAALKALQQPAGLTAAKPSETNGQRTTPRTTISASSASERRASPKPPSEMSQEELDSAMRAAAREAMGPVKKSRSA